MEPSKLNMMFALMALLSCFHFSNGTRVSVSYWEKSGVCDGTPTDLATVRIGNTSCAEFHSTFYLQAEYEDPDTTFCNASTNIKLKFFRDAECTDIMFQKVTTPSTCIDHVGVWGYEYTCSTAAHLFPTVSVIIAMALLHLGL
eukprot:m.313742 g.313742  ORF g.313742 m.313742 type:complete len:143 (-) comp16491_c9_seq21:326-754(-)